MSKSSSSSSSTNVTESKLANTPASNDNTEPNSASSPLINAQPINNEPIAPANARTYPCRMCPMVFSTPTAMGGHQNAHKAERAAKKQAETQRANSLSKTASSVVNPFSVQSTTKGPGTSSLGINWSQAKRPRKEEYAFPGYPPASGALAPLPPVPSYPPLRSASQYFTLTPVPPSGSLSTPLTLSAPASQNFPPPASQQGPATIGSGMFFGVPDFFGPAVAPTDRPDEGSSRHPAAPAGPVVGGSNSGPAIEQDRESEVEEENALDLDLKL
ncbi:U1 small nuclear ribonucleoprotein C-like [Daucus carota subsp. sativus]|uniref:U1 small nuclear ribonucleoprotein C-like n=1 Tax=Daucus carota subsp. sativus TaxID=79200 RepID=UPI003083D6BC